MASSHGVTTIFLMTSGAHTPREVSIVQSLFGNLISFSSGQLSIVKKA